MNYKRITLVFLVAAILFCSLVTVGCEKEQENQTEQENDYEKILSPSFNGELLTFDNATFNVMTKHDQSRNNGLNVVDLVVEDNIGDSVIIDAVQRRNDVIENTYKVKIKRVVSMDLYNEAFQAIEKQDDSYDLFYLSVRDTLKIALNGVLFDYSEGEYIDMSQPWWDQGVIDTLTLLEGQYFALGDVNTLDDDGAWCVLFNKKLLEIYGTTDQMIYNKVLEGDGKTGGWTTEYVTALAKRSYKADESYKNKWEPTYTGAGTYGIINQDEVGMTLVVASGNTPTVVDNNGRAGIISNVNSQDFYNAIQASFEFMGNRDNTDWWLMMDDVNYDDKWNQIARGGFKADKYAIYFCPVLTIDLIRDMESDFGIVPLPKLFDEQLEYGNTIQYYNCYCYAMPYRLDDALNTKSEYILEAMAYCSSPEYDEEGCLVYSYYTLLLQAKCTRDDAAWDMLDILFKNRYFDLAIALDLKGITKIIKECTTGYANNWVSSRDSALGNLDSEIAARLEVLAKS